MARDKQWMLFLGAGSNSLHLMAQGLAQTQRLNGLQVISAAMTPSELHPMANEVMTQLGIELQHFPLLTPLDIELFHFDLVITLGDFDRSCQPNLPGMPPHIHWNIPEPNADDPAQRLLQFQQARDRLKDKISALYDQGFFEALFTTRRNLDLILDNMIEGVMAHTTNRRIFYFNQAAERITGHRREDLLGKDCHDVFPGRFCGGQCDFCEGGQTERGKVNRKEVMFTCPNGERRLLEMATMPLSGLGGMNVGALISFKDNTELAALKLRLKHHHSLGGLIGKDPKMLALFDQIREVGKVNVPVLIEGESGTGKELVANAIHDIGERANKPFVAINCGALPEGILESELFGHVRGAFSGAVQNKKGRFELADGGTIFLDEVGELSPAMQVKLLRVLQEQRFERVGGEHSISVDVRVISATNQKLRRMMETRRFRRDLFYRLCVVPITLPPLRERRLDIPMLVEHFLERIATETERSILRPSTEALDLLTQYPWPGNVRELRNSIEYAYVKCHGDTIHPEHLPPEITQQHQRPVVKPGPALKYDKEEIILALAQAEGNKQQAAKRLGIGRATLYRYLKTFRLS